MKRFVVASVMMLGAMVVAVCLAGCDILEGQNKIAYPLNFMFYEIPGDTVKLTFDFSFSDQTPDESGIDSSWDLTAGNLHFLIDGNNEGDEEQGYFENVLLFDVGVLDAGNYTVQIESGKETVDEYGFTVAESSYIILEPEEVQISYFIGYDTLYRIFPDWLLLEVGYDTTEAEPVRLDSLKSVLENAGATPFIPRDGDYALLTVEGGLVIGDRESSTRWAVYGPNIFDLSMSVLYSYAGDTLTLDGIYQTYMDSIMVVSLRMGNGFDRYDWEE